MVNAEVVVLVEGLAKAALAPELVVVVVCQIALAPVVGYVQSVNEPYHPG